MNIAYCILCHKNTSILKETIDILSKENDIYIHVDRKSDIVDFLELKNSRTILINDREDVRWGGFSQIQATLNLLKSTENKKYDYIFLLSGDCLPTFSNNEIRKFLSLNKGKQYIGIQKDFSNIELQERVKLIYSSIHFKKEKNLIEEIIVKIQKKYNLFLKSKYYNTLPKLYKGPQWFGITGTLNKYILNYIKVNPTYIKAFRYSFCGDELFFQTIIMNSKFKDDIYNYENATNDNFMALRYIDWKTGPEYPKILGVEDFHKIKESKCLFARKFNSKIDLNLYRDFFHI